MSAPPVSHHGIRDWVVRRLRADVGNWRLLLVRTLTAATAVVVAVFVVPGLSFRHWHHGEFLLAAQRALGGLIHASGLLAALLGGLVVGVVGTLLDNIAGATPPILDHPRQPEEGE